MRDVLFLAPQGLIHRQATSAADARHGEVQTLEVTIEVPPAAGAARPALEDPHVRRNGLRQPCLFQGARRPPSARHPAGARRVVSGRIDREFGLEHGGHCPSRLSRPGRARGRRAEHRSGLPRHSRPSLAQSIRRFAVEALARAPELPEWQDPAWLARNGWPAWREALEALHGPTRRGRPCAGRPHRRRLAYDELLAHQLALGERRARRAAGRRPGDDRASALADARRRPPCPSP